MIKISNFLFLATLTLIELGFFDLFRFGGGGADATPLIIFVVCGPITIKFYKGIDNESISSNMEKNLYKIHDVIDNDVSILRKLAKKTVTRT